MEMVFCNPLNTASARQENLVVKSMQSVDADILNVSILLFHLAAAML